MLFEYLSVSSGYKNNAASLARMQEKPYIDVRSPALLNNVD